MTSPGPIRIPRLTTRSALLAGFTSIGLVRAAGGIGAVGGGLGTIG